MADKYAFGGQGSHDFTRLDPPSGTDYVVMTFPPVAIDGFASAGDLASIIPYEGSGTYRLRNYVEPFSLISVDHTVVSALPLHGQTIDDGAYASADYLPFFKVDTYRMHALESPVNTQTYNSCMTNGGCSDSLLASIQSSKMNVNIYYLRVSRVRAVGLTQLTIKQTGPAWSGRSAGDVIETPAAESDLGPAIELDVNATSYIYLPVIHQAVSIPDDDPSANCPCGWFTDDGRMLDFVESN